MKTYFILMLFFICCYVSAQSWSGYNTSNFTGINAVDYQPADIAGTNYKVDILITGVKLSLFNKNLLFNSTGDKNPIQLLLNDNKSNVFATGALYLPSVMYSINRKTSVAFSTSFNAFVISEKSSSNVLDAFHSYQSGQRTFSGESSTAYINSWSSFNLTGARVLLDNQRHRLKIGLTGKLAQGAGSAYFSAGNLGYSLNNNSIQNLHADVQFQYNKQLEDISNGKQVPLFSKSILAADIGVSYEYKNIASKEYQTPYLFKFSTSLRNLSNVIKYESADNSFNYTLNVQNVSADKFQNIQSANALVDTLNSIASISNAEPKTYKTKLPAYFMLMADYQVYKNCFVNVNYNYTYLKAGDDANVLLTYHTFNTTLRYDRKHWGIALPVTASKHNTDVGVSARWRYLIIGSSNIFTLLLKDESSQLSANGYFILKVPIYYKNKTKIKKHALPPGNE